MEEFEPHFHKVVGSTEEEQTAVQEELNESYSKSYPDRFKEFELEKTEEEKEAIAFVLNYIDDIAEKYGGSRLNYNVDKIHVLKKGAVYESTQGRLRDAYVNSLNGEIAIDRPTSNIKFMMALAHELLHVAGFHTAQITHDDNEIAPYRSGLSVVGRGKDEEYSTLYFNHLEEAVIEEVNQKFFKEVIVQVPEFQTKLEKLAEFKAWARNIFLNAGAKKEMVNFYLTSLYDLDENSMLHIMNVLDKKKETDEYKMHFILGFIKDEQGPRLKERVKLAEIIEKIHTTSEGKYTREEIFQKFAEAHFSGKLLPLARMIEEVLGEGEFRKIAEETKGITRKKK
jgi:hypothetical protein